MQTKDKIKQDLRRIIPNSGLRYDAVIDAVLNRILEEVKIIEDENTPIPDGFNVEKTEFYDPLVDFFKMGNRGCYFCDKTVDPNAQQIEPDTQLCPMCQLKLANFLTACNIDPVPLFPIVLDPRKVQTRRIKVRQIDNIKK